MSYPESDKEYKYLPNFLEVQEAKQEEELFREMDDESDKSTDTITQNMFCNNCNNNNYKHLQLYFTSLLFFSYYLCCVVQFFTLIGKQL